MNFEERIEQIKKAMEQARDQYQVLTGQLAEAEFWLSESKKDEKENKKKSNK